MNRIIKGVGGFYYVRTACGIIECKARGLFRSHKITPLVGDYVHISINDKAENTIDEILPRKNFFVRPPVANIDRLMIVSSSVKPAPNTLIIDKITALCEKNNIEPIIILNKKDIKDVSETAEIYLKAGFITLNVSAKTGEGIDEIKSLIKGNTCAFTGNSGVGKSSILNAVDPSLTLPTGEISDKLGRGRHTTRFSQIYSVCEGEVIDTPGFSSLDMEKCDAILKNDLQFYFREFSSYLGTCRYTSCAHIKEDGCRISEAVKKGEIPRSRYENYITLYNQVKNLKEWKIKN